KQSVNNLTALLQAKLNEDEMGLTYEGTRLRASKARTASGQLWVSLRKINALPLPVDGLGFTPQLVPHLRNLGKRDGLVLICGSTGQGKTTTASSLLNEYLSHLGGVAFTIEDPVEYSLEGRHGKSGFCYQVEVKEDEEWAMMLKRSLRWHPRYIFVGEIRTPDAANQLLRAANTGHLVITTVHSGTIEEALEGLLQLGVQSIGDRAAILLATGITAVIHQTLGPRGLQTQFYITEPFNPASPFRACIREKRIGQTRTLVDQQTALMMQGGKIFRDAAG
ncbi:MAG: ATPase, T2SS/T4P/T4SS family, partial [Alphaproteobacteria bacterium]|nr:ATPase, T2SS/T4P/T4SS family [Alphaproteobacteria bacterium]